MKEIPTGASLSTIHDLLPDKFENAEDAVDMTVEILQKGAFDSFIAIMTDGKSAIQAGYLTLSEGRELSPEDLGRVQSLCQAGASLLSRTSIEIALQMLAHEYAERGDMETAKTLAAMVAALQLKRSMPPELRALIERAMNEEDSDSGPALPTSEGETNPWG